MMTTTTTTTMMMIDDDDDDNTIVAVIIVVVISTIHAILYQYMLKTMAVSRVSLYLPPDYQYHDHH